MGALILVVEDDDDVADVMMCGLSREGHELERVDNGTDGIARALDRSPDVMLLDLGLPDMDGLEVCERVRAAGYAGGIIVVTAREAHRHAGPSLRAGASHFLSKPFGLAELRARVACVLSAH